MTGPTISASWQVEQGAVKSGMFNSYSEPSFPIPAWSSAQFDWLQIFVPGENCNYSCHSKDEKLIWRRAMHLTSRAKFSSIGTVSFTSALGRRKDFCCGSVKIKKAFWKSREIGSAIEFVSVAFRRTRNYGHKKRTGQIMQDIACT